MSGTIARRTLAVACTTALAGGALLLGAGQANAASLDFKKVTAPKTVTAGETFLIKCKINKAWAGDDAVLQEKGAPVNAHRTISSSGDCSMHVVLNATGKRKISILADGGDSVAVSKWITINVVPAS